MGGGLSRAEKWGIKIRPSPLPTLIWKRPLLLSGLPMETILELSFSFFPERNSAANSAKHLRIRTQILQGIVLQPTGVGAWQNLCPYPNQVNGNRNHLTPPHESLAKELTRPPPPPPLQISTREESTLPDFPLSLLGSQVKTSEKSPPIPTPFLALWLAGLKRHWARTSMALLTSSF